MTLPSVFSSLHPVSGRSQIECSGTHLRIPTLPSAPGMPQGNTRPRTPGVRERALDLLRRRRGCMGLAMLVWGSGKCMML